MREQYKSAILEYRDTPWNSRVLGYKTNEITGFSYENEKDLSMSLLLFDNKCQQEHVHLTVTQCFNRIVKRELLCQDYKGIGVSMVVEVTPQTVNYSKVIEFPCIVRECTEKDLGDVQMLAWNIFQYGRFFEDPFFTEEIARKRHQYWIEDMFVSLESKIYVAEYWNRVVGFMGLSEHTGELHLGGMSKEYVHLAYVFWKKILEHQLALAPKVRTIISALNIPVIHLYMNLGFKIVESNVLFHKHR